MSYQQPQKSTYLTYVDGLRAIAVFAVFLFHLSPDTVSSGYVGVDIFFVISGYLITNIIKTEVESGVFRFTHFYIRRIKRLFPAFAFVLILCTIAAYSILNPLEIMQYARSGIYAISSVSNIFFYFNSGYFAPAAETQLLLHTWSLSVEEQFYLAWPLLIYLLLTILPRKHHIKAVLIFTIFFILVCVFASTISPNLTFYLTPFRAAEFSIGGILCWFNNKRYTRLTHEMAVITGLAFILYSIFFIKQSMVFPGWIVFIPCAGTALVIYFSGASAFGQIAIGNKYFAYLGRISYPLYLVHWPLIIFSKKIYENNLALDSKVCIMLIAIVLAALIHQFIEQPLKTPKKFWVNNRQITVIYLSFVAASIIFFLQMHYFRGLPGQLAPEMGAIIKTIDTDKNNRFQLNKFICFSHNDQVCKNKPQKLVGIIGDSHGPDAINILYPHYKNLEFALYSVGSCPPLSLDDFKKYIKRSNAVYQKCRTQTRKLADPAFYSEIDYLVFSTLFSNWYTPIQLENFLSSIELPEGLKVLILGSAPTYTEALPEIIIDYNKQEGLREHIASFASAQPWEHEPKIKQIAKKHSANFISKIDYFCPSDDKSCRLYYGKSNKLLTYDKHHLSFEAAGELGKHLKTLNPDFDELFDLQQ